MGQKAETSRYNVHFLLTIYHMDFECPLWLHKQITVNIYLNTAPLWQNTFEMLIFFCPESLILQFSYAWL